MNPFTVHQGRVVAMDRANVDTDQIIPKQFLKRIERTGFGQFLFYDWRFLEDGSDNPGFELNQPAASGASVLLAKRNWSSHPPLQISSIVIASRMPSCRLSWTKQPWTACSSDASKIRSGS